MRNVWIGLLGILLACSACNNNKTPNGILPPEKMQAVLWDYLRADVFSNDFGTRDSSLSAIQINAKMQRRVFLMHNISKETFDKSYKYYLDHRELMKEMLDTMIARHPRDAAINPKKLKKGIQDSLSIKDSVSIK